MRFTYQNGAEPLEGYTILHGIHRGGFGEVYYARSGGGKEVALKLLHEEDQETELRGVTQCLNLKHSNLVNIFDLKTDVHGDHWIIMEYVSGSNLEDVLAAFPNGLPPTEVRDWLSGMVAGVAYLHNRGIVHRDLKPANVYRENGVVKVGDVGLSKLLDGESRRRHTQSVGTVYYMAPEVAQGKYGPEVDVYSLGVVLYEMITGKLPFTGETTAEILMKHLTAQPNLMPIPAALRPVIADALEKDPRKRTPDVKQLELEFLRAVQSTADPFSKVDYSSWPTADANNHRNQADPNAASWRTTPESKQNGGPTRSINHTAGPGSSMTRRESILNSTFVILLVPTFVILFLVVVGLRTSTFPMRPAFAALPQILLVLILPFAANLMIYRSLKKCRPADQTRESVRANPRACMIGAKNFTNGQTLSTDPISLELLPTLGRGIGRAGLTASVLSLGLFLMMSTHFEMAIFPGPENVVLFAAVSIIGSWMLTSSQLLTRNLAISKGQRLLIRIGTGAVIGTVAFGLQQFLNAHIPLTAYSAHPRIYADPTWAGYAGFFAGWSFICRDPLDFIRNRAKRFSLGLTAKSVLMGFIASLVVAFPQWYAMLWAATISTTIQLTSTWSPNSQFSRGR